LKAFSIYGKDWKKYVNVELWNGYMMAWLERNDIDVNKHDRQFNITIEWVMLIVENPTVTVWNVEQQ
jgi:hypothetical protein